MKTYLLDRPGDDPRDRVVVDEDMLTQDLDLDTLLDAMGGGEDFLRAVARRVLLAGLTDPDAIRYRQGILGDCLHHPEPVRRMYDLAVATITAERRTFGAFLRSPDSVLYHAVEVHTLFLGALRQLRQLSDQHAGGFASTGFRQLFATLAGELDDAFFSTAEEHLRRLRFRDGVLISARLGTGAKGADHTLRRPNPRPGGWLRQLIEPDHSALSFTIADRDQASHDALSELRDRGVNLVADALAKSNDHILSFWRLLRTELGFYLACTNLHTRLTDLGAPTCFPDPQPADRAIWSTHGLYEACLALRKEAPAVGNDLDADGKSLVMITGANQGGKSTFLRSAGLAQLMMQAGMFVPAQQHRATTATGLFSHFKREEDASMTRGKFEEELARMTAIAGRIRPGGLLLCNESFAATNEREGSQIASEIIRALTDSRVRIFFVTHLYDLADRLWHQHLDTALFLRAQRDADGTRTFRVTPGQPEPTSYGEDLYTEVFATATSTITAA